MLTRNILLLLLLFISCKSKSYDNNSTDKFDKVKWQTKKDSDYPYRDNMLNDLMKNHAKHGIKMNQILDLLGPPTRSDSLYLFYLVSQERVGFFPIHTKSLVIKFDKDSSLEWAKIKK